MLNPRYFLVIPIFLTTFYSGFSARILPFEKPLMGLCFVLILFFAVALSLKHSHHKPATSTWCFLVAIHSLYLFWPLTGFDTIKPGWALSSFVTYTSVAAFTMLALKISELGFHRLMTAYLAGLFLAMFCAPLAMVLFHAPRFEPPGFFIIAAVLVWFARKNGIAPVLGLLVVSAFALASQVRINFVITLGFAMFLFFTRIQRVEMRFLALLFCLCLLIIALPLLQILPSLELPGGYRIAKLLTTEGFYTEIILRRSLEVQAAWQALSLATPAELLFGHGHGATYPARLLLLDLSAQHSSVDWRFTDNSEAYVLHFGPIRLLYRSGIVGFFLFTAPLFYASTLGLIRLFRPRPIRTKAHSLDFWIDVCALASLMWLAKFLLSPAETDFGFALAVGSCIALHLRARAAPRVSIAHTQKQPATGPGVA